ncbi:hypothetical protein FB451DRAFT_1184185 [Mycena latifolia]|nr:hypothetical protein FB451DRAFT_1184185 [Mycena latifolia]
MSLTHLRYLTMLKDTNRYVRVAGDDSNWGIVRVGTETALPSTSTRSKFSPSPAGCPYSCAQFLPSTGRAILLTLLLLASATVEYCLNCLPASGPPLPFDWRAIVTLSHCAVTHPPIDAFPLASANLASPSARRTGSANRAWAVYSSIRGNSQMATGGWGAAAFVYLILVVVVASELYEFLSNLNKGSRGIRRHMWAEHGRFKQKLGGTGHTSAYCVKNDIRHRLIPLPSFEQTRADQGIGDSHWDSDPIFLDDFVGIGTPKCRVASLTASKCPGSTGETHSG